VRIRLLGPLEIVDDGGAPVEVAGRRLRTLLARLAVDAGQPVSRDALIDAVWPGPPPAGALNALQTLVARLRRVVPVESYPDGYRLPDQVDVDLVEFLRDPVAAWDQWRGEPFDGLDDAPFTQAVSARLMELRLRAAQTLVDRDLARGRLSAGRLAELTELARAHPLQEALQGRRMRALVVDSRPAEALAVFAALRQRLADELGTDPSPELVRLNASILGSTVDAPAGVRLPPPLTSFVGRTDELAQVAEALSAARLVTLVGPGGAGKTRLAVEVARSFAEPVWLVELAPVREPAGVGAAVLAAVAPAGATLLHSGPTDLGTRLRDALGERTGLLVLDNCEHLLDACAVLVDAVLAHCPRVRLLATSREPLAITGERLCPIGPLALPVPGPDLVAAEGCESVRLFVDRARAVQPRFQLTEENLPAVVEVCRRLDGLPLAIELACARLRTLGVDEIAARLGDRFRLLTGGSRTALPRHQTLAAVVDWSWALFDERERRLAGRLAVFAGGADLSAIEAVCTGDGLDNADVVTVLIGLVDKSFVRLSLDPPRYTMLDTIQAYAAVQLAQTGESDTVRHRHAYYLLERAELAEPALRGHDQLTWLAWLRREYDNLAAALRWTVDAGDPDAAVRLVASLGWYWVLGSAAAESAGWFREVLALPGLSHVAGRTLATAYAYDAINQFSAGDRERAISSAKAAAQLADQAEHPAVAIVSTVISSNSDSVASAIAQLSTLVNHGDPWTAAAGELVSGHAAENAGDVTTARTRFAAARDRFGATGDRWGTMMALSALAGLESLRGDLASAISQLTEGARLADEVGADDDRDWMLARRGSERRRSGDRLGARADLEQVWAAGRERGRPLLVAMAQIYLAELACADGDPATAGVLLADTLDRLDRAEGTLPPRLRVLGCLGQARALAVAGELAAAQAAGGRALAQALSIGDATMTATVTEGLAEIAYASGDQAAGERLLGLAAVVRGTADLGSPVVRARGVAPRLELTVDGGTAELTALLQDSPA
jgi:predicted ATPase/DNA-binding SARP family transcriptional activator